jgi:sulfur carrier protein
MRHPSLTGECVEIVVNGERLEVADQLSVAELLERLDIPEKGVAVEINYQIVPRTDHPERILAIGDHVEVVTLVGGG